jgi:hypothetical protein
MTEAAAKKELITPDAKELSFMANGKTYVVEKKISIARRMICDQLLIEISGGGNMGQYFNDYRNIYDLCNEKKFADIAVLVHARMEGVKKWQERHDPVMALAALFINEENEDRRFLSLEQIKAKVNDWEEEGIEYAFFLTMADVFMNSTKKIASDSSLNISEEKKEE